MKHLSTIAHLTAFSLAFTLALASGPAQFTIQGKATDGLLPVSGNFAYNIEFYAAPTGGPAIGTAETGTAEVIDGLFTITLPTGTRFLTSDTLYVQLALDTNSNGLDANDIFNERFLVSAAPYATNADTLDGLDSSDFLAAADDVQRCMDFSVGMNAPSPDGSGNYALWAAPQQLGSYVRFPHDSNHVGAKLIFQVPDDWNGSSPLTVQVMYSTSSGCTGNAIFKADYKVFTVGEHWYDTSETLPLPANLGTHTLPSTENVSEWAPTITVPSAGVSPGDYVMLLYYRAALVAEDTLIHPSFPGNASVEVYRFKVCYMAER